MTPRPRERGIPCRIPEVPGAGRSRPLGNRHGTVRPGTRGTGSSPAPATLPALCAWGKTGSSAAVPLPRGVDGPSMAAPGPTAPPLGPPPEDAVRVKDDREGNHLPSGTSVRRDALSGRRRQSARGHRPSRRCVHSERQTHGPSHGRTVACPVCVNVRMRAPQRRSRPFIRRHRRKGRLGPSQGVGGARGSPAGMRLTARKNCGPGHSHRGRRVRHTTDARLRHRLLAVLTKTSRLVLPARAGAARACLTTADPEYGPRPSARRRRCAPRRSSLPAPGSRCTSRAFPQRSRCPDP